MNRDLMPAEEILRRVRAVGEYYGFMPFSTIAESKRGLKSPALEAPSLPPLDPVAEIVAGFLKQVRELDLVGPGRHPLFVWHTNITPGRAAPKTAVVQFHAIGTDRPIADAVVIRAMRALVGDVIKSPPLIRINTLGDKETRARFARELGHFFKKRDGILPEDCTACAKRDVFEAAEMTIRKECSQELPSPTDYLSDQSRKRFEELLEYLENTETPYELAPTLMSRGAIWSETCFEIRSEDKALAWGSRYADLAKSFFRTSTPAAGAVFRIETAGAKVAPLSRSPRFRFAFVHIGEEAKRESIKLADELRRARLPLWQIIGLESLTEQMLHVEKINPPYLLVMGRKEALERTVVLRNRATQEDISIPLLQLTERLKIIS